MLTNLLPSGSVLGLTAAWLAAGGVLAEEGLFADFQTSMGAFTAQLDYTNSPTAVASFVALATGDRPWLDEATAAARSNSFHQNLTFHRVIAGFMIQGGSPNGLGTDGPGYVFPDEFASPARHDAPGVLSMANSGPNSNGSQFFITVTNTPWLDGVHTIFGRVVEGLPVVHAISQVPTGDQNRPVAPIVVQGIGIRREGVAAQAFDIHAQNLPTVSRETLHVEPGPNEVMITYSNQPYADLRLGESADLTGWSSTLLGIDIAPPLAQSLTRAATDPAHFFTLARIQYPHSTRAPRTLHGRQLTLHLDGGAGTLVVTFDGSGGGSYVYGQSTGSLLSYDWSQAVYNGSLWPIRFSALIPMTVQLRFRDDTSGTLAGRAYPDPPGAPFDLSGQFELSAPLP